MSRNYWLPVLITVGLIFGVCASAESTTGGNQGGHNSIEAKRGTGSPYSVFPAIQYDIHRIARSLETASDRMPSYKEENRADRNLAAQEDTARWAFIMIFVGVLETCITACGVILVWHTLKASWAAAEHGRRAADAAEKAIKVTRDVGRSQTRAYVAVKDAFLYQGVFEPSVMLKISNIGQTPVRWIEIEGNAHPAPEKFTADNILLNPKGINKHRWSIDPGQEGREHPVDLETDSSLKKIIEQCGSDGRFVIQGTVRWETMFAEIFESTFFYWGSPQPLQTKKTPDGSYEIIPQRLTAPSGVKTVTHKRARTTKAQ